MNWGRRTCRGLFVCGGGWAPRRSSRWVWSWEPHLPVRRTRPVTRRRTSRGRQWATAHPSRRAAPYQPGPVRDTARAPRGRRVLQRRSPPIGRARSRAGQRSPASKGTGWCRSVQATQSSEASATWIGIDGGPSSPGLHHPDRDRAADGRRRHVVLRLVRALPPTVGGDRIGFARRPDGRFYQPDRREHLDSLDRGHERGGRRDDDATRRTPVLMPRQSGSRNFPRWSAGLNPHSPTSGRRRSPRCRPRRARALRRLTAGEHDRRERQRDRLGQEPSPNNSFTDSFVPSPHGYWLVGSDGGIFSFGEAQFYGSTGSLHLQRPVVGIVPTADRGGYWLDASDGGVFSYGDTQFYGSIPGLGLHPAGSGQPNSLNAPIVGMVPSIDDNGYFMVASDGGVFAFGDAHFAGSCPGIGGCSGTAVAVMPDAQRQRLLVGDLDGQHLHVRRRPLLRRSGPRHRDVGRGDPRRAGVPRSFSATVRSSTTATPPPTVRPPSGDFDGLDAGDRPSSALRTAPATGSRRPSGAVYNFGDRTRRRRDGRDPPEWVHHRRHGLLINEALVSGTGRQSGVAPSRRRIGPPGRCRGRAAEGLEVRPIRPGGSARRSVAMPTTVPMPWLAAAPRKGASP